jgi:PAS domain S-box-containing protein
MHNCRAVPSISTETDSSIAIELRNKYRALVEAFEGLTYVCSQDYRIEFLNDNFIRRIGRDATGEKCYEALHDLKTACPWCVNERVFRGETVRWEVQSPKDQHWFYVVDTPIRHADGTVSKQAVIQDITGRKQEEEALRQSEHRFRSTFENAAVGFAHVSLEGRYINLNQRFCDIVGYPKEELLGKTWQQITHSEDLGTDLDQYFKLRDGLIKSCQTEKRYIRKDGSLIWANLTVSLQRDEADRPDYYIAVVEDITDHKRAERALQASEEFNRQVVNSTFDCIKVLDTEGLLLFMSPGGQRMLGLTDATTPIGTSWIDFWSGDDRQKAVRAISDARAGRTAAFEGGFPLSNGNLKWWDVVLTPIQDAGGKVVRLLCVSRDATEHKLATEALIRSEKLASVGRMAATIAHEINNPLEAVMNTLFLARTSAGLPEPVRQYLDVADDELRRISHITCQALGFHRESVKPSRVSLRAIMDSAIDMLNSKITAKHVRILKQYKGELHVIAVGGELRQVFSNLLSNSLDALDEKGTISLRLSTSTCVNSRQQRIRVTIADNGKGINAVTRPRIFEPLFTTKEATGSGLGLWVCKQLIDKHHGSIRMHSSTDAGHRGTVFSVLIPA